MVHFTAFKDVCCTSFLLNGALNWCMVFFTTLGWYTSLLINSAWRNSRNVRVVKCTMHYLRVVKCTMHHLRVVKCISYSTPKRHLRVVKRTIILYLS